MGKHSGRNNDGAWSRATYPAPSYYQARHVDTDRQPGRRPVDAVPDEWFDPGIDRSPNDPDLGVR